MHDRTWHDRARLDARRQDSAVHHNYTDMASQDNRASLHCEIDADLKRRAKREVDERPVRWRSLTHLVETALADFLNDPDGAHDDGRTSGD